MGYRVSGQLVDNLGNPIEFGTVYTSDSKGKPLPNAKTATTDDKGRWTLDGVNDSDYITGRMVGLIPKTFPAKSIVPVDFSGAIVRAIKLTLNQDVKTSIPEIKIEDKKVVYQEKKLGKYIMIGSAIVLGLTAIVFAIKSKTILK